MSNLYEKVFQLPDFSQLDFVAYAESLDKPDTVLVKTWDQKLMWYDASKLTMLNNVNTSPIEEEEEVQVLDQPPPKKFVRV